MKNLLSRRKKSQATKISRVRRIIYSSLAAFFLVVAIIISYYVSSFFSFVQQIQEPIDGEVMNLIPETENLQPLKSRINILLIGGDSRGRSNSWSLADSNMILSIDPKGERVFLFSILRDTYVSIPGHKDNRINTALMLGGPKLAVSTVESLTGLNIEYFMYTDFQGFVSLIDALGGIKIDVEKDMKRIDTADDPQYNIDLKKGTYHLDGLQALQYVRFRSDSLSDFGRAERQRKFLKLVADKLQSPSTFLKLPELFESVQPYIKTNISNSDLLKFIKLGMKINTSNITEIQIPPAGMYKPAIIRDMDVLQIDPEQIRSFIKETIDAADRN